VAAVTAFGRVAGTGRSDAARFAAPWSLSLWVVTLLCTLVCLVGALHTSAWLLLVPAVTIPFAVRGYVVRGRMLIIQRPFWSTRIALGGLRSAHHDPHAMDGGIRTFGIGGLFSFTGYYWNRTLGAYQAFVNDPRLAVVLVFADRRVLVSPDRPRAFARWLHRRIEGRCAERIRPQMGAKHQRDTGRPR